jgi:hypothetical protein
VAVVVEYLLTASQTVDVLPYIGTVENEYGNTVDAWATQPTPTRVYAWGPVSLNETTASRDTVTADVELFAPTGFYVGPKDHIRLDGQTYEVQSGVESFDHGPFNFHPGVRVNLRRFAPS